MLGCFAKEVEECPLLSTATIDQLSPSKTFLTIDSEFEALQAPPTPLSSSSVVYCASEMFRYLRDMALGVTSTQTRPLLTPPPDRRAERPSRRHHSGYLVHPGAVLCMVDLLPCLEYDLMVMESGGGIREEEMTDQLSREVCDVYLLVHSLSLTLYLTHTLSLSLSLLPETSSPFHFLQCHYTLSLYKP